MDEGPQQDEGKCMNNTMLSLEKDEVYPGISKWGENDADKTLGAQRMNQGQKLGKDVTIFMTSKS